MGERVDKRRLVGSWEAAAVPVAFLGLGLYRAWIEVAFVGSFASLGASASFERDVFDLSMVATSLLFAFAAHRIGSIVARPGILVLSVAALTLSTLLAFLPWLTGSWHPHAALMSAVMGGAGIGVMILGWSELLSRLSPLRVSLYYAASIVFGALVLYVYRGFMMPWLFAMTLLLPAASALFLRRAAMIAPGRGDPRAASARFSVPWRAIALMSAYAFAYGLMEGGLYAGAFGPHSAPGTLLMGLAVLVGVAVLGERFDLGAVYRLALPLMVVGLFLFPTFGHFQGALAELCLSAGYTAQSVLIMVMLASICYRYGVSAIWLFGIERAVRQVSMWLGRSATDAASGLASTVTFAEYIVPALTTVAIVGATTVMLSEREFFGGWGSRLMEGAGGSESQASARRALADSCVVAARAYGLTAREGEVLLLLGQRRTARQIEQELMIANGTVKAHIRHIYRKMGIHSRDELLQVVGVCAAGDSPAGSSGEGRAEPR
ncbi:helix-turn-helix transcriptional regulator [Eggerthellaceae bacterium zg-1084]|uniref:response regulator transcription factor n=1 Tax=Berryella wangjianweii TaxID=2734634 RepID=UPI001553F88E|nr:LuxR C-terminal-related transcriptional regulator [Berryella wangjianweii]NPD31176.1 helix-turn-helix transcriptional regulator [Berryella wangjianweii]